jgi:hypothetical protein
MVENILNIAPAILAIGIFYGATNSRIKALENIHKDAQSVTERLAILETKIDLLLKTKDK